MVKKIALLLLGLGLSSVANAFEFVQVTNSTSNPVNVTSSGSSVFVATTSIVNVATVTFNGSSQPVNTTNISTVTFNGTAQPTYSTNIATVTVNVGLSALSVSNPLPVQSTGTTTVAGTVTANISGSISNTGFKVDISSVNGTTISASNPVPTHDTGTVKVDGSAVTQPVSGTFWQTTQPVSVATPYQVFQSSFGTYGSTTATVVINQPTIANTGFNSTSINVTTVTFNGVAQAVNATAVNVGTVTISGTPTIANTAFTANAGTNLNTSALALESGGNLATLSGGVANKTYQVSVTSISGSGLTLGQKTMANSIPFTLASDQPTIPVTLNGGTGPSGSQLTLSAQLFPSTVGTINSVGATVAVNVSSFSNVTFQVTPGTGTGAVIVFEGSMDNQVNWFATACDQSGAFTSNTTFTTTTSTIAWTCSVAGYSNFRVRQTVLGTGIPTITEHITGDPIAQGVAVGQSVAANLLGTMSQGGTWTVQPGNTANTTAWKVDNSAVTQPTNVTQIGGTSIVTGGVNGLVAVGGPVASNGANADNPLKTGVVAYTSVPSTTSANGNILDIYGGRSGEVISQLDCGYDLTLSTSVTLTTTTSETLFLSSGAANVFNMMVAGWVNNTSATATRVDFVSGGGPSGKTVDFAVYVPAGDMRPVPLAGHRWPQSAAASNWTVKSSASVTDVRIAAVFCKSK